MKKSKLKILIGVVLTIFILNIGVMQSKAVTAAFTSAISSTSVQVGDTITVTVTATNAAGIYKVAASSDIVSLTSGSESEFIEKESKTIQYKATKAGTVTITAGTNDMTDSDDSSNKITGSKSYTVTIKEKSTSSSGSSGSSSSSSGSSGSTTTKPKTPAFKSANQKVYTNSDCNLRTSWSTTSSATSVKKGTELTLTGTSTEKINNYTWYRVTYQGSTKYIASSLITYTKPKEEEPKDDDKNDDKKDDEKSSNKTLSSLKIEGIEITPEFDKDTTQYTAHVDGDVTELKIDTKAEDSKAKVSVEGNKDLKEGDNIIKVKVTAEDNTTRTYFITVTKGEGTEANGALRLSELKIARVDFEDSFKPDVHSYELELTSYVKQLDITAVPSQTDATVEITGNEEFKEGQNVIIILLTSADGKETANYQIKVTVPAEVIENAEEPDTIVYVLAGIAIAVIIIAIILVIKHNRSKRDDDYDDEEETEEEEQKPNVTLDDFLNAPDDDDDDNTPRGTRGGRHSK